jgi:hypothetical protein
VLTGAGLGDQPRLTHTLCQQRLPYRIVDLVGASMIQIFAFQEDARAA